MANTYTQLYIHLVFSPKNRTALIKKEWKDDLEKYITGIVQNHKHKLIAIGSMPDHIHIFIGMRPVQSISSLVQNVKSESSKWIKENKFCRSSFAWQEGFGAFSYSKAHVDDVIRYIQNQEAHHGSLTYVEELMDLLEEHGIDYDEKYLL